MHPFHGIQKESLYTEGIHERYEKFHIVNPLSFHMLSRVLMEYCLFSFTLHFYFLLRIFTDATQNTICTLAAAIVLFFVRSPYDVPGLKLFLFFLWQVQSLTMHTQHFWIQGEPQIVSHCKSYQSQQHTSLCCTWIIC